MKTWDTNEPGPIHNIIALGDYAVYSGIQGIGSYANVNINLASTVNDGASTAYDVAVYGFLRLSGNFRRTENL